MAKATVLDSEWLKRFIEDHIEEFHAALTKMLKDDVTGRSVSYISEGQISSTTVVSAHPLILGSMAGESDLVNGAALNTAIQQVASAIHKIFSDHGVLFEEVEDALWATIKELKENQVKSLDKITAESFLEVFEDVATELESGGKGG
ncbi:type VII secretion system-associated protein, partial [Streptomyces sp. NPDC060022]|uniref:type VII secretion system-associated protein n=1 Tax=Streptomyces sp. NPDC060022 TaxID=3347039 RepID=UPI0036AE5805